MKKLPKNSFHLFFSLVMGAMMVFLMTAVITLANVGMTADFLRHWLHAFLIAYPVAVPVIYLFAPIACQTACKTFQIWGGNSVQ